MTTTPEILANGAQVIDRKPTERDPSTSIVLAELGPESTADYATWFEDARGVTSIGHYHSGPTGFKDAERDFEERIRRGV